MAGILLRVQLPKLLSLIFRVQRSAYYNFTVCWTGIQDRDHGKWYLHQLTRHEHTWQKSPLLCGDGTQTTAQWLPCANPSWPHAGWVQTVSQLGLFINSQGVSGQAPQQALFILIMNQNAWQLYQGLAMSASSPHRELQDELHPNLAYTRLSQRTKTKQGFQRQTSR